MKVVITGASGFVGQEVIRALQDEMYVEITALSRHTHEPDENRAVRWAVTDYTVDSLSSVIGDADAVIHLAAVRGTAGTLADYSVNEIITENILIAAGECAVKRVIFASSIAVYSDASKIPWKEDMMLTPKTLYGITKAACEHLCQYYSKKFGYDCCIVRIAQVLGPGERRRVMTNVFMNQALRGEQLHVTGRSIAKRQYIYSKDLARVLAVLAVKEKGSLTVNVGMEKACTNLEIAQLVNGAFHNESPVDYDDSFEETIEPSQMCTEVYHTLFDFKPMSMEEALRDIAAGILK